jgi:hypothetical protein
MSVFLTAALQYAAAGWAVFPCHPKTKVPATPHGFKDATKDPALIRAWWDEEPGYNVAIATGEISGIFVLDVDQKPGRTLDEAIEALPSIPDAPTVQTGGGGRQFFFKFPAGSGLSISGGRLGLGVDTRGNGGYVVAPPSVHDKTGMPYEWIDSDGMALPETPGWIVDRLRKQVDGSKQLASKTIQGGRHDALMTAAALMRGIGLVPAEIEAALFKMKARLDLSDGRVIEDREIQGIAQWCGDKGMGDVNVESVLDGKEISKALAANRGAALSEIIGEPGISDPGPFPAELLNVPGIAGQWCDYINRTSHRRQPELALAAVLTACGALIGRRLQTVTGGRANLYCLGLCETGGGKERARQGVKEVLFAAEQEELIGQEDWASETGLVSSLMKNPTQLYQIDEIGKLLAAIANPRAGSHLVGIVSALLKLYSSANTVYKGKAYADAEKNPVIYQPHACLYGTAVPDQAWEALGASAVNDGLLARLWVFMATDNAPERQVPALAEPPADLVARIREWGNGAGGYFDKRNSTPPIVDRTEEGIAVMAELVAECDVIESRMRDTPLRKLWTRTAQKADQLALVYAWSRSQSNVIIDREAALWASRLAQYLTQSMIWHASRHLAGSMIESDLKAVIRYVEESGAKGRTRRDIVRRFQRIGKRGLEEIMLLAETGDHLVSAKTASEGTHKPTTTYYLPRHAPALVEADG